MVIAVTTRTPPTDPDARPLRLTPVAALSFLCGALHLLKFNVGGELYGTEALLLVLALVARPAAGADNITRSPQFRWFLVLGFVSLAGYMISDLVSGSGADQFLRGWARISFVITDFIALSLMIANDRRNLWWFALGLALGAIAYLKLVDHAPIRDMRAWKFGYCVPVILGVCCAATMLPLRVSSAIFVCIGLYSVYWDARIYGAMCFFIAAMLWVRAARRMAGAALLTRLIVAGGIAGVTLAVVLSNTHESFEQRRDASNFGRAVALRVGYSAVLESPIIGWGSWPKSPELVRISRQAIRDERERFGQAFYAEEQNYFSPHSQILQAWVEGGLLGASFFIFLGVQMLRGLKWTVLSRRVDRYTPMFLFYLSIQLWHLVESPLGQTQRMHVAVAAAIAVSIAVERRVAETMRQALHVPGKSEVKIA